MILVAYASKHGATAEIAEVIADELRTLGHTVDCRPAGEVGDVTGYDGVVVGSAVYMRRWQRDARRLLRRHDRALSERDLWLFSSGPTGPEPDWSWAEPRGLPDLAERLGAHDHAIFGGRLPLEPSGFVERAMVRDTPPEQRDLRDWTQIRRWARDVAAVAAQPAEAMTASPASRR